MAQATALYDAMVKAVLAGNSKLAKALADVIGTSGGAIHTPSNVAQVAPTGDAALAATLSGIIGDVGNRNNITGKRWMAPFKLGKGVTSVTWPTVGPFGRPVLTLAAIVALGDKAQVLQHITASGRPRVGYKGCGVFFYTHDKAGASGFGTLIGAGEWRMGDNGRYYRPEELRRVLCGRMSEAAADKAMAEDGAFIAFVQDPAGGRVSRKAGIRTAKAKAKAKAKATTPEPIAAQAVSDVDALLASIKARRDTRDAAKAAKAAKA